MNERIRELANEVGISVEYLINTKQIELLEKFAELVRADEREACAKVCDGWTHADGDRCAEAIRARGEK